MNAEEIRSWAEKKWSEERRRTEALIEIAAQLSETNQYLKCFANPPILFDKSNIDIGDIGEPGQVIPLRIEPRATLRDQFAMAALSGLLSSGPNKDLTNGDIANIVYTMANAMMEARKK